MKYNLDQAYLETCSGKIMGKIISKISANELDSLGDISTLVNSKIEEKIIKGRL